MIASTLIATMGTIAALGAGPLVAGEAAAVDDDTLNITGLGTTKRLCHDHSFQWEMAFLHVLAGEIDYRIEEDSLWLIHPDGKGLLLRAEAS